MDYLFHAFAVSVLHLSQKSHKINVAINFYVLRLCMWVSLKGKKRFYCSYHKRIEGGNVESVARSVSLAGKVCVSVCFRIDFPRICEACGVRRCILCKDKKTSGRLFVLTLLTHLRETFYASFKKK